MNDEIKVNIVKHDKPEAKPETKSKSKRRINKKNLSYFICAVVSIVAICVIVVVIVISINKEPISDDYFVSDDTKSVISLGSGSTSSEGGSSSHTRIVYTFDGDKVTGLKTYFEFPDNESAAAALESYKSQPEFKNVEQSGKYIIVTSDASSFEGLTADDVRQQAAAIEQMQSANKQPVEEQNIQENQEDQKDQGDQGEPTE